MERFFLEHALLPSGWARDVRVACERDGRIAEVRPDARREPGERSYAVAVPGLPNVHSHAFQRAMAGLTEARGPGTDSFWTWRERMYRFVARLSPEDVEAIATLAFSEMLESGFTRVCEFHYLHHAPGGEPYAERATLAAAIARAAAASGIGLTLLPVFYAYGGFGEQAPGAGQRRFVNDPKGFAELHGAARDRLSSVPGSALGLALHSLRAVSPASLREVLALAGDGPVHIHVAEQPQEVEACIAWCGARPVEWLLANAPVDRRWCLVHATHMTPAERDALAASGAVAGVCPITEANLGDGIFDAVEYLERGGSLGVGSDSNVEIDAARELALLEYTQRLRDGARNRLSRGGSTGRRLLDAALAGGRRASGSPVGALEVGAWCDVVALDRAHPSLAGADADSWLDGWIFSAGRAAIADVWVRGRRVVERGVHLDRDRVRARYRQTLARLL